MCGIFNIVQCAVSVMLGALWEEQGAKAGPPNASRAVSGRKSFPGREAIEKTERRWVSKGSYFLTGKSVLPQKNLGS